MVSCSNVSSGSDSFRGWESLSSWTLLISKVVKTTWTRWFVPLYNYQIFLRSYLWFYSPFCHRMRLWFVNLAHSGEGERGSEREPPMCPLWEEYGALFDISRSLYKVLSKKLRGQGGSPGCSAGTRGQWLRGRWWNVGNCWAWAVWTPIQLGDRMKVERRKQMVCL